VNVIFHTDSDLLSFTCRTDNAVKNRFWSATRSRQRKAKKEAKKRAIAAKAQEIEEEQKQFEKRVKIEEGQDVASAAAPQMQTAGSPGAASAESSFHTASDSGSPQQRPQPPPQPHPQMLQQQYLPLPQQYHQQQPFQAQEAAEVTSHPAEAHAATPPGPEGYVQAGSHQEVTMGTQTPAHPPQGQVPHQGPPQPQGQGQGQRQDDPEEEDDRKPPAREYLL
jgi:hypothetical protein